MVLGCSSHASHGGNEQGSCRSVISPKSSVAQLGNGSACKVAEHLSTCHAFDILQFRDLVQWLAAVERHSLKFPEIVSSQRRHQWRLEHDDNIKAARLQQKPVLLKFWQDSGAPSRSKQFAVSTC